jgi:flagellar export protein FliJ
MGFQFSLASVLRIRCIAEEKEERLLQKILLEINQTREAIARTQEAVIEAVAMRESSLSKAMTGCFLHAFYLEVKSLKQVKEEFEEKLRKLIELRDRQVKVYETARRNREMLSSVHDAELNEYNIEISRAEQKMLDDIYSSRQRRVATSKTA